mmetsp:Transcript_30640/g.64843  ORF Transcript_30640/g.64843 Transcript_30640/m.64843 type:complete len:125 (-) Transcript_30640:971-1345(-)
MYPFLNEVHGDLYNEVVLEEAKEDVIPHVTFPFIRSCLDQLGAPKTWKGEKARSELLLWVDMSVEMRQLAFKTKAQLMKIAIDRGQLHDLYPSLFLFGILSRAVGIQSQNWTIFARSVSALELK